MANFGRITARVQQRAAKFEGKLRKIIERAPEVVDQASAGASAILSATARLLASFGSETVRLNRLSRQRLNSMDPQQQNKLKTRAIDELQAQTREQIKEVLERYTRGKINVDAVRENMQTVLRRQTLAAAIIGVGGVGNLTENVLTAVRRQLTEQFKLLDGFIDAIADRQPTARDRARAAQFANSAYTISQTAQRQLMIDVNPGQDLEERRRLGGSEHCEDCIALAEEGWQDAGTLPPPGQGTVCGNSCRCSLETRVKDQDNQYV